ncbi:MAG TPA: mononuclear molybdenum enzyme YedY, partial [Myxococcota bacterium]|nr:mononuclear molybdenum enzyme YedY [Myxococcota bacterium]
MPRRILPDPIPSHEITPEPLYLRRREFLRGAAVVAGGVLVGGCMGDETANAVDASPDVASASDQDSALDYRPGPFSTDEARTDWADATSYNNFYELGTGKGDPARNAH